ncbi:MAG: hypothetical protein F4120_08410 [Rhodothermaceae bacterium]|nr:hypothetical protein [Rhodothermaceae bacterium]MYC04341.1 hypothetical protein [Rhodothermaceae bacterium]MYI17628.1 hypothetical protein [Rhodothermaceae bacterium]
MLGIIGSIIGAGATVAVVLWAVIKKLIPGAIDIIGKRIEYTHKRELVKLDSILKAHTTSLTNSMDIASRIGDSSRDKTIESVELLWKDILHIQRTFASQAAIVSILTKDELIEAINDPASSKKRVREALIEFASEGKLEEVFFPRQDKSTCTYPASDLSVMVGTFPGYLNEIRPFVSDNVYALYCIHTFAYCRLVHLVRSGMQSREPVCWTDDELMIETISAAWALTGQKWENLKESDKPNFRSLIQELNRLFLHEAKKCIRGTDDLAESASEINLIYRAEEAVSQYERGWG